MRRVCPLIAIILLTLPIAAQMRRHVAPPVEWTRILLPYKGGSFGSAAVLGAEFVMRNDSDHPIQYHLYQHDLCAFECVPIPRPLTMTLAPGMTVLDWSNWVPQGRVLSIDSRDVDAVALSLRAQEFWVGGPIGPEGAFKGPEIPLARERDFKKSIHIISVPVHLNTYLRVYALDSAPTVHVKLFDVEVDKEFLLDEYDLTLAKPVYDAYMVMQPALAELDLSAALAAMDQRIPQGRISFRIDSPDPVWAMVMQHDPERHVVSFVTAQ